MLARKVTQHDVISPACVSGSESPLSSASIDTHTCTIYTHVCIYIYTCVYIYMYIYIYHTLFNTPLHNNNCVILSSGRPLIVALIEDPGVEERGLRDEDESQVGKPLSPALSPESIYRLMTL